MQDMHTRTDRIVVTAMAQARQGLELEAAEMFQSLVPVSRAEPGCIAYDLYQSADDDAVFMFYETWDSRQDLDAHLRQPHIQAFMKQAKEVLAGPLQVTLWKRP